MFFVIFLLIVLIILQYQNYKILLKILNKLDIIKDLENDNEDFINAIS